MKKIVVGIDCDDVLNKLIPEILEEHFRQTGIRITEEEIDDWNLSKFGINGKLVFPKLDIENVEPKIENIEALKQLYDLKEKYSFLDVYVVSQCPVSSAMARIRFIKKYYPMFPENTFIPVKDKGIIRLDYLVDDAVHNAKAVEDAGGKPYLLNICHNKYCTEYTHINSLKEFVEILENILSKS
ncbi:MAG: hypothetical protein RR922_03960 [Clostridia bacterium]